MIAAYVKQIQARCPQLVIEKTELNDTGQYSTVVIVNDALVFRFPRYARYLDALANEAAILDGLQRRLPLPIPNPIYQAFEPLEVGKTFIGYALIPGEPLWRETVHNITSESTLDHIAGQIGAFLRALHSVPASAIQANLQRADTVEQYRDKYERIQAKLYPYMRPDARESVTAHFESYLSQMGKSTPLPRPCGTVTSARSTCCMTRRRKP